jgi:site-specific recombinase XerD
MKEYTNYLVELGFAVNTTRQHCRNAELFIHWLARKGIDVEACTYNQMIGFIDEMLRDLDSRNFIRRRINQIMVCFRFQNNFY